MREKVGVGDVSFLFVVFVFPFISFVSRNQLDMFSSQIIIKQEPF